MAQPPPPPLLPPLRGFLSCGDPPCKACPAAPAAAQTPPAKHGWPGTSASSHHVAGQARAPRRRSKAKRSAACATDCCMHAAEPWLAPSGLACISRSASSPFSRSTASSWVRNCTSGKGSKIKLKTDVAIRTFNTTSSWVRSCGRKRKQGSRGDRQTGSAMRSAYSCMCSCSLWLKVAACHTSGHHQSSHQQH